MSTLTKGEKEAPLSLVIRALHFAASKHRDQRRKDHACSPYINHPIALVQILVNEVQIDDEIILAAALLHDTVEDTDTLPEEIERLFGPRVRSIVAEVTDDRHLTRSERKALQIQHAPLLSREAAIVKIADKIANLRDMQASPPLNWTQERKDDYRDWAQKVVEQIQNPHPGLLNLFHRTIQSLSASH